MRFTVFERADESYSLKYNVQETVVFDCEAT